MKPAIKTRYEKRSSVLKALAHPVRLFFTNVLSRGPRCVCELTDLAGQDMSTVSKHLLVLKNAGIVQDEKKGAQVFYSLKCPCVTRFFTCVEEVLKSQ